MFGPHLMLDCYDCDPNSMIKDQASVLQFLTDLAKHINMTIISGPHVVNYPGREDSFDQGGFSATLVIAESHITIHAFKGYNYMNFDIFSCKPFDVDKTIAMINQTFSPKKYDKKIIFRGEHFPREKVKTIMNKQRKTLKA